MTLESLTPRAMLLRPLPSDPASTYHHHQALCTPILWVNSLTTPRVTFISTPGSRNVGVRWREVVFPCTPKDAIPLCRIQWQSVLP